MEPEEKLSEDSLKVSVQVPWTPDLSPKHGSAEQSCTLFKHLKLPLVFLYASTC